MKQNKELKRKAHGFKRFLNSVKYSVDGLKYAYTNEQSLTLHVVMTVAVVIGGSLLDITNTEWIICLFLIGLIMATELINTSLECLVDLVTSDFHPLAKAAKDTASAAVFMFSVVAGIIGCIIFIPYIVRLFM